MQTACAGVKRKIELDLVDRERGVIVQKFLGCPLAATSCAKEKKEQTNKTTKRKQNKTKQKKHENKNKTKQLNKAKGKNFTGTSTYK